MSTTFVQDLTEIAEQFCTDDCDVYLHSGSMFTPADDIIIREVSRRPRRSRAVLVLATHGGLARTAYRMMRALRHGYRSVTVIIDGPCKSAGTLVAIGGDEIVMSGGAELGPLDVQILKKDEIDDRQSGLTPTEAFTALGAEARAMFQRTYRSLKQDFRFTTTTASRTAGELTVGLFAPISAQIDPFLVGEVSMANGVAQRYANELTKHEGEERSNVNPTTIDELVSGYPSHDYVIDRTEAKRLFQRVRHPTDAERRLLDVLVNFATYPMHRTVTTRLTDPPEPPSSEAPANAEGQPSSTPPPEPENKDGMVTPDESASDSGDQPPPQSSDSGGASEAPEKPSKPRARKKRSSGASKG